MYETIVDGTCCHWHLTRCQLTHKKGMYSCLDCGETVAQDQIFSDPFFDGITHEPPAEQTDAQNERIQNDDYSDLEVPTEKPGD